MSQSTFITVSDVQAALNATYDQASQVYAVHSLNVAAASFQAHVNFANNYASSILGTEVTQTDPLCQIAWNVALDIACIRVLVLSARKCLTLPIELGAGYSDED
jgi:hypothetical protein